MPRDYRVYLENILEAIQKIRFYTEGYSYETFVEDSKTIDAVVRNLEIIGEAVKHVSEPIRESYPDVPWRKLPGFETFSLAREFRCQIP